MARLHLILFLAAFPALAQNSERQSRVTALASRDSLHQLSESIEALSEKVSLSVVQIFSTSYTVSDQDSDSGDATTAGLVTRQRSSGSGVILSPDGYIITNNHVVRDARRVRVQLASLPDENDASTRGARPRFHAHGKLLDAKIVGVDRVADLAVLKIDAPGTLPVLALSDSEALHQGQVVLAFGNPLGLENSVSIGIISSVARQVKPDDPMAYIQTDAPINPGNSGGPLLDADGNVVGINTFILTQSGGSEGIGFAIPSNIVRDAYQQIRTDGHVHRGEIGVVAQSITPDLATGLGLKHDTGVILGDVTPDGPADKAGLKPGDVLLSLNGHDLYNAREFETDLYRVGLNQTVTITAQRGTQRLTATVRVQERDDDPFRFVDLVKPEKNTVPKLGIIGIPITKDVAKILPETRMPYGVIVAARTGDAEYAGQGGLKLGDIIYTVNTTPVSSLEALRGSIDSLKPTDPLVLQIERDGNLMFLTLSEE